MKDDEADGHSTDRMSKGETSKSGIDATDHPEKDKKQGDTNKVKFRHSFQLRTQPEGYNSGRQYIVQARSEEERQKIVADLAKFSKMAIDKHLAKSQFRKTQVRARAERCARSRQYHSTRVAGGSLPSRHSIGTAIAEVASCACSPWPNGGGCHSLGASPRRPAPAAISNPWTKHFQPVDEAAPRKRWCGVNRIAAANAREGPRPPARTHAHDTTHPRARTRK